MTKPLFNTITPDDWKHRLAAARARRKAAPERIAKSIRLSAPAAKRQEGKPAA